MAHLLRDNYDGDMLGTHRQGDPMIMGSYAFGIMQG